MSTSLFRFGIISDIQYADINDAMNFGKTEHRNYRGGIRNTQKSVSYWNALDPQPIFGIQLGDIIDGQNSGSYGQGLDLKAPQSTEALEKIMHELKKCSFPLYHTVGNHELYNFSWEQLKEQLNIPSHCIAKDEFHFSFSPYPGWRCIVLNSYAISIMQSKETEGYQKAHAILAAHNHNFLSQGKVNYFDGLEGLQRRFVPFNGGFGEKQIHWLKETLQDALQQKERLLLFVHNPIYEAAASDKNLAFDYDAVLDLLHQCPKGSVAMVLAGHYHQGGYAQDDHGIHHITIKSPLTHGSCFAYADVFEDRIVVTGVDAQPSFGCVIETQ